jgi:PmbA protein
MNADATLDDSRLRSIAERVLGQMRARGFDHAQVTAHRTAREEINVDRDEPSLFRSTESIKISILGFVDGRRASVELGDFHEPVIDASIARLFEDAQAAPRDAANDVSSGQCANIIKGPQEADLDLLAAKLKELLIFRESETPLMHVDEASACHQLERTHIVTSGGSNLAGRLGWYSMNVFGTARDGKNSSSFNYRGGTAEDLAALHATEFFGIGQMMRESWRQIHTQSMGGRFVGDVVLTPNAVGSLLVWLLGQLGDTQLIAGSSLYRDRVGQEVASPHLSVRSRFDAPGVLPISADAFNTPAVEILRGGALQALTPSLYGSRKTGLRHVPIAAEGWEIVAGDTPLTDLVSPISRGALVGRLSMGNPAANGDFSGVIKNSFAIVNGEMGPALSEVMIAGNVAQMLRDIRGVSQERIDTGATLVPWLRIADLHFS